MQLLEFRSLVLILALTIFSFTAESQIMEFWGTSSTGCGYSGGGLYKINSDGSDFNVEHSFFQYEGKNVGAQNNYVINASNGKLYGTAGSGGANNSGIIYEYDPILLKYTKKLDFGLETILKYPLNGFVEDSIGLLYGMAGSGGKNGKGGLYSYNIATNQIEILLDFDDTIIGKGSNSVLTYDGGSILYGVSRCYDQNFTKQWSVLFEYNIITKKTVIKHKFEKDQSPMELALHSSGKIYGPYLGSSSVQHGGLFEYDLTTDSFRIFHLFTGANGSRPYGGFTLGSDGLYYGITHSGGTNSKGVIYSIDPNDNTFSIRYNLLEITGRQYMTKLTLAANSKFYGVSWEGGAQFGGTLFEYNPVLDTVILKLEFSNAIATGYPGSILTEYQTGSFFGLARDLGSVNYVFYSFSIQNDSFTKHFTFEQDSGLGLTPNNSLFQASNGVFYGTTEEGGQYGKGVLYAYNKATNAYSVIADFKEEYGIIPIGKLVEGKNNKIYGITDEGGKNDYGTLYAYDFVLDTFLVEASFNKNNGLDKNGDLVLAYDGNLYGTSRRGGATYLGVIYEFNTVLSTITIRYNFTYDNGYYPISRIKQAINGNLYGFTSDVGHSNEGVIYEYNLVTDSYSQKYEFINRNDRPILSFFEAKNRKFYSLLYSFVKNIHILVEHDPLKNTYSYIDTFNSSQINPNYRPRFIGSRNGNLIGFTYKQASYKKNVIYEYDLSEKQLNILEEVNDDLYFKPEFAIVEVNKNCSPTHSAIDVSTCGSYISPSGIEFTEDGIYYDIIKNYQGCDSIITIQLSLLKSTYGYVTPTICNPGEFVTPSGKVLKNTGFYNDTIKNVAGCDSIIHIYLNVYKVYTSVNKHFDTLFTRYDSSQYQWLDCDNGYAPINGDTNYWFVPKKNGNYALKITTNGCTDTSDCTTVALGSINLSEMKDLINIYPNPTQKLVHINFSDYFSDVSINVINMQGKLVNTIYYDQVKEAEISLPVIDGIYFIKIIHSDFNPVIYQVIKN